MDIVKENIQSNSLIRDIYRSLLNSGRTYAAFEHRHKNILNHLTGRGTILDPMSGYGGLMKFCCEVDPTLASYSLEFNPPAYFWQVLINPCNNTLFRELCRYFLLNKSRWPDKDETVLSDNWFPQESLCIIYKLWDLANASDLKPTEKFSKEVLITAFLLPFSGRFSTSIRGNVVTHVKKGGICLFEGWKNDFEIYIQKLYTILKEKKEWSGNKNHLIFIGDARNHAFDNLKFSSMLTSPPYPNMKDYTKMFGPENYLLGKLEANGFIHGVIPSERAIGASDVNERFGYLKKSIDDVISPSAKDFLLFLASYDKTKRAVSDIRTYYLPYFCNYFYALEAAYANVSKCLANDFVGYIVVVNNTARKKIVPVSNFVIDTWHRLGFKAEIEPELSKEMTHVGGINRHVKGLSARHTEFTIKVYR